MIRDRLKRVQQWSLDHPNGLQRAQWHVYASPSTAVLPSLTPPVPQPQQSKEQPTPNEQHPHDAQSTTLTSQLPRCIITICLLQDLSCMHPCAFQPSLTHVTQHDPPHCKPLPHHHCRIFRERGPPSLHASHKRASTLWASELSTELAQQELRNRRTSPAIYPAIYASIQIHCQNVFCFIRKDSYKKNMNSMLFPTTKLFKLSNVIYPDFQTCTARCCLHWYRS